MNGTQSDDLQRHAALHAMPPVAFFLLDAHGVCAAWGGDLPADWLKQGAQPGMPLADLLRPEAAPLLPVARSLLVRGGSSDFTHGDTRYRLMAIPATSGGCLLSLYVWPAPATSPLDRYHHTYQALLEQVNDGVFLFGLDGEHLEANQHALDMLGYTREEFLTPGLVEAAVPEEIEQGRAVLTALRAGEHIGLYERHMVRKDGRVITVEINPMLVHDEHGKPLYIQSIVRDVTMRKQLQADFSHMFERVLDSALVGIIVVSAIRADDGHIRDFEWLVINPAAERLLGASADALRHRHTSDFLPQTLEDGLFRDLVAVVETGEPLDREYGYEQDGVRRWVRIAAARLADGVVISTQDITETKYMEEALRANEERFRLLAHATSDGLLDWDMLTDEIWLNDGYTTLFGEHDHDKPAVDGWGSDMHPEDRDRVLSSFDAALASNATHWQSEYRRLPAHRNKENRYLRVIDRVTLMRDAMGRVIRVIGALTDITDRYEAEQRALQLAAERERINLLTSFIAAASHDFRQPLSIINTSLYLLTHTNDPEQRERHTNKLNDQVVSIAEMVDGLLLMAQVYNDETYQFEPVDLNTLLRYVRVRADTQISDNQLTCELDLDPDLPRVQGDHSWLFRCLLNLVENAIAYTPPGRHIVLRSVWAEQGVLIEVQDEGVGIAPEFHDRIFDYFFRIDEHRPSGGQGIGLTVARKIAERHGGTLTLTSAPGEGSTFRIALPFDYSYT